MTRDAERGTPTVAIESLQAELRSRVEEALDRCLASAPAIPPELREPMAYSLFAGGKRIRPILALLACRACGGSDAEALPAACAVEMIHTYSLVHDDLPAMDDDDLRRGQPTSHVRFGEASAILAGDALLTHAFSLLARETPRQDRVAPMVRVLADAAGPEGMVGGQALDLAAEGREVAPEEVRRIHRLKTAALFAASARLGAEAGGCDEGTGQRLERYGELLGLAFQAIDDVLDEEQSSSVLGKTAGKDRRQEKATATAARGVSGARSDAERWTRQAREIAASLAGGAPLAALADRLLRRIA